MKNTGRYKKPIKYKGNRYKDSSRIKKMNKFNSVGVIQPVSQFKDDKELNRYLSSCLNHNYLTQNDLDNLFKDNSSKSFRL